mgnify:CR=1 FL=1
METNKVIIIPVSYNRGLFSYLTCVLAVLSKYEHTGVSVYIDWSGADNYADPIRGRNVFDYFFEQPFVKELVGDHEIIGIEEGLNLLDDFFRYSIYSFNPSVRTLASRLLKKYIRIKPQILKKVDDFCLRLKGENVLGVHIRSTDQYTDGHFAGQPLCLERYLELIDQAIFQNGYTKIFAASDSEEIIDLLGDNFRNLLTYDCIRSPDHRAIHLNEEMKGYRIGEDVLVESQILSRCQYFIASPSNVSSMVTFWNCRLPFLEAMRGHLKYLPAF